MNLWQRYLTLKNPKVIGIMSGTSIDAVDAALVEVKPKLRLIKLCSLPLPEAVRSKLHDIFQNRANTADLLKMHWLMGDLIAAAALKVMKETGIQADLIASHGQTVFHLPKAEEFLGFNVRGTLQIGEGAVIAEKTGCLTACDFRPQDLACGGQGAPLVPFADRIVFYSEECDRIALNIGGMANITWIPKEKERECLACDTGPGNAICDRLAEIHLKQNCDYDGSFAAQGRVIPELLERLMEHPFMKKSMPKSTGREEFGEGEAEKLYSEAVASGTRIEDLMRTAAAFTAASIAFHINQLPFDRAEILVGGGGINNKTMMLELKERLGCRVKLMSMQEAGIDPQAREAMAFAVLGHCCALGIPCNLPSATGASRSCCMGKIVMP